MKETAADMVAVPPSYAAFYGPGGCVTTYKGPSGSCIMETSCEGEDMSGFTYGLMCVDGKGERVRWAWKSEVKKESLRVLRPIAKLWRHRSRLC